MNVQFDEDEFSHRAVSGGRNLYVNPNAESGSKMGSWLVRHGLSNNAMSSNFILIAIAFFVFFISIYLFIYGFHLPNFSRPIGPELPPEELEI